MADPFNSLLREFLLDAHERLGRAEAGLLVLAGAPEPRRGGVLAEVRRELHTIKGNAGMMGLADVQRAAHLAEDAVAALDVAAPRVEEALAAVETEVDQAAALLLERLGQLRS